MELSGDSNEESSWQRSFAVMSVGVAKIKNLVEMDSLPVRFCRLTWNVPSFWRGVSAAFVPVCTLEPGLFSRSGTIDHFVFTLTNDEVKKAGGLMGTGRSEPSMSTNRGARGATRIWFSMPSSWQRS